MGRKGWLRAMLPFVACLMLVLVGWTGTANAGGNGTCIDVPQTEMAMHVAVDCDQVPADADKNFPHHHAACHGHCVATPGESRVAIALPPRPVGFTHETAPLWLSHQGDAALRPPQA
ncbi:hypothetical protein DC431_18665 [Sphingomonas melonis]|nr:hypothetical protein DC425_15870 [Sphingomonas sp. TPD3009]PVE76021.1 hypothetical protein DC431_18665 [Sphingomonas melonis]